MRLKCQTIVLTLFIITLGFSQWLLSQTSHPLNQLPTIHHHAKTVDVIGPCVCPTVEKSVSSISPTTTTTTSAPTTPSTTIPNQTVTTNSYQYEYIAWSKVAVCEEGGWVGSSGYAYPDSLGINRTNWFANGGMSDVSPAAQIAVAERIQTQPPDQSSCAPW